MFQAVLHMILVPGLSQVPVKWKVIQNITTFKAIFIANNEQLGLLQKEEFGINDTIEPHLEYPSPNYLK